MVWAMNISDGGTYTTTYELLDGDYQKIEYADQTLDTRSFGSTFPTGWHHLGREVKLDHVPSKLRRHGRKKKNLPDVFWGVGMIFVRTRFRQVLESIEPNIHQYSPVELFWTDGEKAANVFYFNVCNRLDTVDHDRTEHEMYKGISYDLGAAPEKKLVFDLKKVGQAAIWRDRHLQPWGGAWVSDKLKRALEAAGISGVRFQHFLDSSDFGKGE